jgi:hypothetical protein
MIAAERSAMAATMTTAGEYKSPTHALQRLAGARIAVGLLRRTFTSSKWYVISPSTRCDGVS